MTDEKTPEAPFMRRIQTFMRRSSPFTASQKQGMADYAPRFLLPRSREPLDVASVFGRAAPLTVEIGFGMGYSLAEMAEAAPDRNFIGIEIHEPGVAQLCYELGTRGISNVRILDEDALELLETRFADGSIDTVQLYFPDPWQKARHFKRRFVNATNAALIRRKLKTGGIFHMATDWENYAEWMLEHMEAAPGYENVAGKGLYSPRPDFRPLTKFEKRGQKLGHGVWDLLYKAV
ncbi:MAG TPA: tRNA (guanosine(46)-N7)-methyltransferase TrmB [Moraxellaceae bacterium]|nr:tRNA (guanosine(46)-N7)-methyltransferase TrmB [Moraxellaceae bacterium]